MKLNNLTPVFTDIIPDTLEPDKLYVSKKYGTSSHLCACGCPNEVVTPLDIGDWSDRWTYKEKDGRVSLSPSIGNYNIPCRSHYFIKENRVEWC